LLIGFAFMIGGVYLMLLPEIGPASAAFITGGISLLLAGILVLIAKLIGG